MVLAPEVEAPGAALPVAGQLEGCEPAGSWKAHGTFPHTGDCKALPDAVDVAVKVVRAAGGYRLVFDGDGEVLAAILNLCHGRLAPTPILAVCC